MAAPERDPGLDTLLALDGQTFFLDEAGAYWVKFTVWAVAATDEYPHGLRYALTLHDRSGARLVGFDNAHLVSARSGPAARIGQGRDHKHRLRTVRPYAYADAAGLLADFWAEVDSVLREKGVLR